MLFRLRLVLFAVILVLPLSLCAQENVFNVSDVNVVGNKKTDTSALLFQVEAKAGQVSHTTVDKDIKSLYGTGFFEQVEAVLSQNSQGRKVLQYVVTEKPIVRKVFIEGNKGIDNEDIETALDYRPGRFFDALQSKKAIERVESAYQGRGYYDAAIEYSIVPTGENKVDVTFKINEGEKYKIRRVSIIGLKILDDDDLLTKIQTTSYKWWSSWLLGTGRLNQDMLDNDRNILRQELLNNGFIEGTVSEPMIKKEDRRLYVSFRIDEGPQFKLRQIGAHGDLIDSNEVKTLEGIESKPGDIFNSSTLRADALAISDKFTDIGYAFANVVPDTNIDKSNLLVDVNYQISKGNLVTVDRINIRGNQKT